MTCPTLQGGVTSGLHLNHSLWTPDGRNVMKAEDNVIKAEHEDNVMEDKDMKDEGGKDNVMKAEDSDSAMKDLDDVTNTQDQGNDVKTDADKGNVTKENKSNVTKENKSNVTKTEDVTKDKDNVMKTDADKGNVTKTEDQDKVTKPRDKGRDDNCAVERDGGGIGLESISSLALRWNAGLLRHAAAMTALCCPTVNCYRRLNTSGNPSHRTWSLDNRNALNRFKVSQCGNIISTIQLAAPLSCVSDCV